MIAACPKCKTKFRIARERLRPEGVRLRCTQCSAVFRVKAPDEEPVPPSPEPAVTAETTPMPRSLDRNRLVLFAHSDADVCKQAADALEGWGLYPLAALDGVEAILATQRQMPRVVVLDAALPKMYGFQVCELIKRNESLRSIGVVLVGSIHDRSRYRRPATDLYGADVYLEGQDLPDALRDALARLGVPVEGASPQEPPPPPPEVAAPSPEVAAPAPEVAAPAPEAAAPVRAPVAEPEPAPPADDGLGEARRQAERLARIIVSDVILYNEDKFLAAVAAGNVSEALDADLDEGRALFQARVDPAVVGERDYLREELIRVAKQRGMA